MNAEFSRVERLDAIGGEARTVSISADEGERAALAARFGLLAVERLDARFSIRREAAGIAVEGKVEAQVIQACSVTGEPVPATIAEPVRLRYVEPRRDGDPDAEVELGLGDVDTIELEGGGVDLGEAAAETMALALDPFPRAPGAEETLRDAGVISEDEAGPFGALAGLKAKLEGRE